MSASWRHSPNCQALAELAKRHGQKLTFVNMTRLVRAYARTMNIEVPSTVIRSAGGVVAWIDSQPPDVFRSFMEFADYWFEKASKDDSDDPDQ